MKLRPEVRLGAYALVFAARDLFPFSFHGKDFAERARSLRRSFWGCISALLNLVTLTVLVFTISLVGALYLGTLGFLRAYVESNPLARTVEVSSIFGTHATLFDPPALAALSGLESRDGRPVVTGAYGWNDVTLWLYTAQGERDDSLTHGRTVDGADPVLSRIQALAGAAGFAGDGTGQAIVSVALLDDLGYGRAPAGWPPAIQLEYADLAAPVRVAGVAAQLPAGDFLITEAFNRQLQDRLWDPLPRFGGLYLGPIVESPELDAALADLAGYLAGPRIRVEVEKVFRAGTEKALFFRRTEGWTRDLWLQLFLPVVLEKLGPLAPGAQPEPTLPLGSVVDRREALEPRFTRASVYVEELRDVPEVADLVAVRGYQVTSNSREMALLFLQVSSLGRALFLAVILVVGGLAAVSLVLSFSQSIQRKTPEIAILKAFGSSNLLVLGVYVIEALLLWLAATVIGLGLAACIARRLDARLIELLHLRGEVPLVGDVQLIALTPGLQLAVAGGALLLCTAATVIAGSVAVALKPAQALSLHR